MNIDEIEQVPQSDDNTTPVAERIKAAQANNLPIVQTHNARSRLLLILVAMLVIGGDQYTKILVERNLQLFEVFAPIPEFEPFFRIMHVYNTGAAFGIFPAGSQIFAILAVVVSILILIYNFTIPGTQTALRIALGLQLGGAMGNFIDRMRIGHVTDFLDFGPWPLFNVADTAIVAGAIILGWLMIVEAREMKEVKEMDEDLNEEEILFSTIKKSDERVV